MNSFYPNGFSPWLSEIDAPLVNHDTPSLRKGAWMPDPHGIDSVPIPSSATKISSPGIQRPTIAGEQLHKSSS